jgi:uncharacterized protein (UPF0548 family)
MPVELLNAQRTAELRSASFTYAEVGATAVDLPAGYQTVRRTKALTTDFDTAARKLLGWQVQRSTGLRVTASSARVEPDAVVVVGMGPLRIPCRVVYLVDEPGRRGFAYGTLPGHPVSGEEAFVLEQRGDSVTFTVTAFSRPATLLTKLGGPAGRLVQKAMIGRYLRALG